MNATASLVRRLTIVLTIIISCFWLLAAIFGMLVMFDELDEAFDSALEQTAQRLLPLAIHDVAGIPRSEAVEEWEGEPLLLDDSPYLTYQLRDAAGAVLLYSTDGASQPFPAPLGLGFFTTETHRFYTTAYPDQKYFLQISDPLEYRLEAVIEGGAALLLPLLAMIPVSLVVVRLAVRYMLSPIGGLRDQIAEKDGGDMTPIKDENLYVELRPIVRSVNLLLGRLKAALETEREFTANSAHELRTPIAGALAQTQRLIAELPEGDAGAEARARRVEQSLIHLGRLAEKLLQLSRAEAGIAESAKDVDLLVILDMVVEEVGRNARHQGRILWNSPAVGPLIRKMDPDAFAIIMRNLLENALSHSPSDSQVFVFIDRDQAVHVVNDGPVLDEASLASIRLRFVRGKTKASGSGLGLAIVQRLLEGRGSLRLLSPAEGRKDGFEAVVAICDRPGRSQDEG